MNIDTTKLHEEMIEWDDLFQKEIISFFHRIHRIWWNILIGDSRKMILSFVEDIASPMELCIFFQFLRKSLGWVRIVPNGDILLLYHDIFQKLVSKRWIFQKTNGWKVTHFSVLFHQLRDISCLPECILEDFQKLAYTLKEPFDAVSVIEMLRFLENYWHSDSWKELIRIIWWKIFWLNLDQLWFMTIKSLVVAFEHVHIEIPEDLLYRWNTLQNEEWEKYFTATPHEEWIVQSLIESSMLDGYTIKRNKFICWYEVDIILYDTKWDIFAIIESDGKRHFGHKTKIKDQRRDNLFLQRWITDTIIRCSGYNMKSN